MQRSESSRFRWWMIPLGIALLPLVLALAIIMLLIQFVIAVCLHLAAWCRWNARGRDVLFVYSNSPIWQEHIETEILPVIRNRAVILNWSDRNRWRYGLATAAFGHFGGRREFNPLAVVFRPLQRARVFRFWQPFRDWKHGNAEPLHRVEHEFFEFIGARRDHVAE